MKQRPPKLARQVLKMFARGGNIDDLLGDLDEWFDIHLQRNSPRAAKLKYWKQAISLSFSYAVRKRRRDARFSSLSNDKISFGMLKNYIKIALRNIYQHKYFSVINAFGLAIGMSVSLLVISLYSFVSTYDNFHKNGATTYTIISDQKDGVEEFGYATAPLVLASKIEDEFTGVNQVVRIVRDPNTQIKTIKEDFPVRAYYTEPSFFSLFTFELLKGTAASLRDPNQVILTETLANKLFRTDDVIGKLIELKGGKTLVVSGLMKDIPNNTHFSFEMLVSLASIPPSEEPMQQQWQNFERQYVYVNVVESPEDLQAYLDKTSAKIYSQSEKKIVFEAQHLHDIATGRDLRQSIGTTWEMSGFILFSVFAALILLPACFNYTNISIARALKRSKEIGLRKTMGGVKKQIFFQFLTETVVITLLSLGGALLIFMVIRSEFQSMLVAGSTLDLSLTWRMVLMFFAFAMLTGLLAGIFPALYFSSLNPIQALKNNINTRGSSMRVRKILTVAQFTLSFGFILSLVVFSRQYRYSVNFDFGFDKSNIVNIELQDTDREKFRTEYSSLAAVQSISMSSSLPGLGAASTWVRTSGADSIAADELFIDEHFLKEFSLTLVAGRNFPGESWQRERYALVNEEFAEAQKLTPLQIIGHTFMVDSVELEVIGVVKNFHYAPLTFPIGKLLFRNNPARFAYANLQVAAMEPFQLFTQLETTWKNLGSERRFVGNYFEDDLKNAYSTYTVLLKMVGFLGLLAITISMLGMLGMVVFTAETKTKEVGIRKVMGATIGSIAYLLSRDYLKLMAIAIVIAIPITAFFIELLLEQLQYYRVRLSVWDVLVSSIILITIGLATIASQTYKTATTNPAATLRSE